MKKLLLFIIIFLTNISYSQWIKPIEEEYGSIIISLDPYASYKEKGLNLSTEILLISYFGYVKTGSQIFSSLKGGYVDISGGAGLNQKSVFLGIETRIYEGIRGGLIFRKNENYPLFGTDFGIDFKILSTISTGFKFTNDWREDMKFSGANPKWVQSIFITTTIKL